MTPNISLSHQVRPSAKLFALVVGLRISPVEKIMEHVFLQFHHTKHNHKKMNINKYNKLLLKCAILNKVMHTFHHILECVEEDVFRDIIDSMLPFPEKGRFQDVMFSTLSKTTELKNVDVTLVQEWIHTNALEWGETDNPPTTPEYINKVYEATNAWGIIKDYNVDVHNHIHAS